MAKDKTIYVCDYCGQESLRWVGKCPACNRWNTMKEMEVQPSAAKSGRGSKAGRAARAAAASGEDSRKPLKLKEIDYRKEDRISLGMPEVDRLLGGGKITFDPVLITGNDAAERLHFPTAQTPVLGGDIDQTTVVARNDKG